MSQTVVTALPHPPGKWITCIVPADNGLDIDLLTALKEKKGLMTTCASRCRGYSGWQVQNPKTKTMPLARPVSVVTVAVTVDQAEDIFIFLENFIASSLKEGNTLLYQGALSHLSLFELPVGIPEETCD